MFFQFNFKKMMDNIPDKVVNLFAFAGGTGATVTSALMEHLPAVMYWVVGGGIFLLIKILKYRQESRHKEDHHALDMQLKEAITTGKITDLGLVFDEELGRYVEIGKAKKPVFTDPNV